MDPSLNKNETEFSRHVLVVLVILSLGAKYTLTRSKERSVENIHQEVFHGVQEVHKRVGMTSIPMPCNILSETLMLLDIKRSHLDILFLQASDRPL